MTLPGSAFSLLSFYLISSAKFTNPKKYFLCNTAITQIHLLSLIGRVNPLARWTDLKK
jgi:hypothetical protein